MPVVITAGGDARGILLAQLTLLTTTALAARFHAALHRFLPNALQALGAVDSIAGVLGRRLAHGRIVAAAAGLDGLGILAAQLALLSATSLASDLDAVSDAGFDSLGILTTQLALLSAAAFALLLNAVAHSRCTTGHQCKQKDHAHESHAAEPGWESGKPKVTTEPKVWSQNGSGQL